MNLRLREWNIKDLEVLVKMANNPKIASNLTDSFPYPYTLENGKAFIAMALSSETSKIRAIEFEGEIAGSIGIHFQADIYRKNAELGYYIAEPYWNKGLATEAIRLITKWGFEHFDLYRLFARPFGHNIGSQRALEKAGYQLEATIKNGFYKNGQFIDELIYSRIRE